MANVLSDLPHAAAVAVIRLRSLGDCVLTTPALALLHAHRPDLRIGVVVEERFAAVFEGNPAVRAILPPTIPALRQWNAQLCVNLHGGTRSMTMTASSGARVRAGFDHFRYAGVYNVRIPRAQEILGVDRVVHTAEHLASAVFYLGVPVQPIPRASLWGARVPTAVPGGTRGSTVGVLDSPRLAVIHPVAAAPEKTWPAAHFLRVAEQLERQHGLEPVFIGGPGDDLSAFARFRCVEGAPLNETKSLIASAAVFVGNDSGPAHIAAAFGIPVVVIYGPSDPVVWAPWRTPHRVFVGGDAIGRIQPDEVIAAVGELRAAQ
jgi:heptosyltransferase III